MTVLSWSASTKTKVSVSPCGSVANYIFIFSLCLWLIDPIQSDRIFPPGRDPPCYFPRICSETSRVNLNALIASSILNDPAPQLGVIKDWDIS